MRSKDAVRSSDISDIILVTTTITRNNHLLCLGLCLHIRVLTHLRLSEFEAVERVAHPVQRTFDHHGDSAPGYVFEVVLLLLVVVCILD